MIPEWDVYLEDKDDDARLKTQVETYIDTASLIYGDDFYLDASRQMIIDLVLSEYELRELDRKYLNEIDPDSRYDRVRQMVQARIKGLRDQIGFNQNKISRRPKGSRNKPFVQVSYDDPEPINVE